MSEEDYIGGLFSGTESYDESSNDLGKLKILFIRVDSIDARCGCVYYSD